MMKQNVRGQIRSGVEGGGGEELRYLVIIVIYMHLNHTNRLFRVMWGHRILETQRFQRF